MRQNHGSGQGTFCVVLFKQNTMRNVLIMCLSLLLAGIVKAQNMSVGPEIGLNLIQLEKQDIGNNYQPGWYGGLAYEYKINDWLSVRTGAYYSQSRQAYNSEDTSMTPLLSSFIDSSTMIPGIDLNTYTSIHGRQSLNYLQVPVQANFSWNNIQLSLGGYFGFLIGARQKESIVERTPFMSTIDIASIDPTGFLSSFLPAAYKESFKESSETTNLRVFDYGLKAGIGYQFNQFGVQASYSFGLPDYRTTVGTGTVLRNKYFQFSIRYMFAFGKTGFSSIR